MSDLIKTQAAIDALDRIFDRCEEIEAHLPEGDPDRTGYKMYPDYMTVWKYLHQLPSAQPEQQWIPCSEPPTEHGFYHEILLYGKDGNYAVGWYDEDYFTWDDRFDMDTPVAWKPLPEPWRGEKHGET